jgi:hypothetical protein
MLGDGNSEAGAKELDKLVAEIRKLKTGKKAQAKGILQLLEESAGS